MTTLFNAHAQPPRSELFADRPMLSLALKAGLLLCDVPTPALLLDHSTAATTCGLSPEQLDRALNDADAERLTDLLYVHASVTAGRDSSAGAVGTTTSFGFGREAAAEQIRLATLDCTLAQVGGDGAYCGLGLNNHLTGGYYWGRSTGVGAAMEAPGVALAGEAEGALRLVRVENSNDGKRSEWCEFLTKNDQVQIVPASAEAALAAFDTIVGVTRDGHRGIPRGAEPMIEAAWTRVDGERWERVEWSEAFEVEPDTQPKGPADFLESWKK
jgi:hypothetical protein